MHLERLTLILEVVGQKGQATVSEICAHSELPKPTTYRLVQDLVAAGLLEPISRGQFAIGSRLKRITQNTNSDRAILEIIAPILKRAADHFGAAFFLSRLRGKSVEIIHVETPENGVSFLHPGLGKRPLHACSCSKAVAAFSPKVFKVTEMAGKLRAYTEFTRTNVADLEKEIEIIRLRGFAECVEEIEKGICSVAAPLAQSGLGASMSIGATGSQRVFTPSFRAKLGPQLGEIAKEASEKMGWQEEQTLDQAV